MLRRGLLFFILQAISAHCVEMPGTDLETASEGGAAGVGGGTDRQEEGQQSVKLGDAGLRPQDDTRVRRLYQCRRMAGAGGSAMWPAAGVADGRAAYPTSRRCIRSVVANVAGHPQRFTVCEGQALQGLRDGPIRSPGGEWCADAFVPENRRTFIWQPCNSSPS